MKCALCDEPAKHDDSNERIKAACCGSAQCCDAVGGNGWHMEPLPSDEPAPLSAPAECAICDAEAKHIDVSVSTDGGPEARFLCCDDVDCCSLARDGWRMEPLPSSEIPLPRPDLLARIEAVQERNVFAPDSEPAPMPPLPEVVEAFLETASGGCAHADVVEHRHNPDGSIDGRCEGCGEEGFPVREALDNLDVPTLIAAECDAVRDLLLSKNAKCGNSALEPARIFSKASHVEQILVRIDDKLSRIRTTGAGAQPDEDTVQDLIGYLILLRVAQRKAKS